MCNLLLNRVTPPTNASSEKIQFQNIKDMLIVKWFLSEKTLIILKIFSSTWVWLVIGPFWEETNINTH